MELSTEGSVPLSRNKPTARATTQVLEAVSRNIPKLKEQNYTQWRSAITHSIKAAKLWGYIDGSTEEPSEDNTNELIKYMGEASAVRSAILGSLEPGAQRHIEDALAPREAWLQLERQYLSPGNDDQLVAVEQQLVDLRLEEDGDVVEHLVNFCRLRQRLHGTRLALDEQTSIELLYRSLPLNYRQLIPTPDRTETKDFSALCTRLRDPDPNKLPDTAAPVADTLTPTEDFTNWGVPEDIKTFGLTGDKNPLLEERAAVTCRDCLLKNHEAGEQECPQYEWRRELWGTVPNRTSSTTGKPAEESMGMSTKRFSYEFSEPVKVVLDFGELGLRHELRAKLIPLCPKSNSASLCYSYDPSHIRQIDFDTLVGLNHHRIVAGTPDYLLGLINRKVLKMHNLKLLVLDDVDKLIEAGAEERILEIYRQIPPLAQIVASCTVLTSSIANTTLKFLVDPLQIAVDRDEGISVNALHFFVPVRDSRRHIYYLNEAVHQSDRTSRTQSFKQIQRWEHNTSSPFLMLIVGPRCILVTTKVTLPLTELANCRSILVNYDITSDTEEFFELTKDWRETHSGQDETIIT
ncbi:DEAD-box protein, partial [Rhizoctonia solani 123E]